MLRKNKHNSGSGTADRTPNQQTKNTRSTQNKDDYKGTIQVLNPIERERAQCVLYVLSWRYEHKQFGIRSIKGKVPHEALLV